MVVEVRRSRYPRTSRRGRRLTGMHAAGTTPKRRRQRHANRGAGLRGSRAARGRASELLRRGAAAPTPFHRTAACCHSAARPAGYNTDGRPSHAAYVVNAEKRSNTARAGDETRLHTAAALKRSTSQPLLYHNTCCVQLHAADALVHSSARPRAPLRRRRGAQFPRQARPSPPLLPLLPAVAASPLATTRRSGRAAARLRRHALRPPPPSSCGSSRCRCGDHGSPFRAAPRSFPRRVSPTPLTRHPAPHLEPCRTTAIAGRHALRRGLGGCR